MKRKMFLLAALIVIFPAILISAYPEAVATLGEVITAPVEELLGASGENPSTEQNVTEEISADELIEQIAEEENISYEEMSDYESYWTDGDVHFLSAFLRC